MIQRNTFVSVPFLLGLLGTTTSSQGGGLPGNPPTCYPPTSPTFFPLIYDSVTGKRFFGRHQYYEDRANTVFSLARDIMTPQDGPPGVPDVILFNFAHFDPPQGVPAATRRIMKESIEEIGLQLYVNYTGTRIDPATPAFKYLGPTFFLSEEDFPGDDVNDQTDPPVPDKGFFEHTVSATRGAFGVVQPAPVTPHSMLSQYHGVDDPDPANALYVTAGIAYGLPDIDGDSEQQDLARLAMRDRLLVKNASGFWEDKPSLVPSSVRDGNSSGVAFADFNGDGFMDLYVGKCGDNYLGAPNRLLFGSSSGAFSEVPVPQPVDATTDVVPFDVDGDGDLDIVVANRCRSSGSCGAESQDYVLVNDGAGVFDLLDITAASGIPFSDTRSVAVGDIDKEGGVEIVLGNAGSDGFENEQAITPLAQPLKILSLSVAGSVYTVADVTIDMIHRYYTTPVANEPYCTESQPGTPPGTSTACKEQLLAEVGGQLTQQVLLIDLFGSTLSPPPELTPDGWLDLVVVNHRDIPVEPDPRLSRVYVLANTGTDSPRGFTNFATGSAPWTRTVCFADFVPDGEEALDMFMGRGNRFSGVKAHFRKNLGGSQPLPWDDSISDHLSYDALPGVEHAYGFDFADVNGDGFLDALQLSRGYNYFVDGIGNFGPGGTDAVHLDLAEAGNHPTSNKRGKLVPRGMEDGVFADFDADGDLDAIAVGNINPSPDGGGFDLPEGADTKVLVRTPSGEYRHNIEPAGMTTQDTKVSLLGRTNEKRPEIADRVVAGDLDNDGFTDAIVHLFPIYNDDFIAYPMTAANGFTDPLGVAGYSAGWRYLANVHHLPYGGKWFADVAAGLPPGTPARMKSSSTGTFDPNWNRSFGMDLLGDLDNNGYLDLYTTVAQSMTLMGHPHVKNEVATADQARDLVFLNAYNGNQGGTLVEVSTVMVSGGTILPAPAVPIQGYADPDVLTCGAPGLAGGDIDNDGMWDIVVTHPGTQFPWLLMNQLDNPASPRFIEEYLIRVPTNEAELSDLLHSHTFDAMHSTYPGRTIDNAIFPTLGDFDADGDLDLAFAVTRNVLRLYRNKGADTNGDGFINSADSSMLGYFEDATEDWIGWIKPTIDASDMAVLDIDRDGDLDIAVNPWADMITFWRNEREADDLPVITEIWPRVGARQGDTITLKGVRFGTKPGTFNKVEFVFPSGTFPGANLMVVGPDEIRVDIPASTPPTVIVPTGLAQVRIRRTIDTIECGQNVRLWSRQKMEYFVQGN